MKRIPIAILLALGLPGPVCLQAENFVGPTSTTNRLVVATNECIAIFASATPSTGASLHFTKDGRAVSVELSQASSHTPLYFAGPCEFVTSDPWLCSFSRFKTTAIQTVILTAPGTNFFLPSGKEYANLCVGNLTSPAHSFTVGTNVLFDRHYPDYFPVMNKVSGPVTVGVTNTGGDAVWTFSITDEHVTTPINGALIGPSGNFEFAIERSTNLSNWTTVIQENLQDDTPAYYRMRISK